MDGVSKTAEASHFPQLFGLAMSVLAAAFGIGKWTGSKNKQSKQLENHASRISTLEHFKTQSEERDDQIIRILEKQDEKLDRLTDHLIESSSGS